MFPTPRKFPPVYLPFFCYTILILGQWPVSLLIQSVSLSLGILLNEWVLLAGLSLLVMAWWKLPANTLFPFQKPSSRPLFYLLLMTLSLVLLIDYLMFLSEKIVLPGPEVKTMLDTILSVNSFADGIGRWFLICLTPAICEELFFRGFFQTTLQHYWGKRLTLIVTAIAFSLIHGIPAYWHLYFILGLFLGWLMFVSKNLLFPILAHLLNNSWTYLTHLLNHTAVTQNDWQPADSFIMLLCLALFIFSAIRFQKVFSSL